MGSADLDLSGIDEVLARLDSIIEACLTDGNRMGWFAAMYRRVTLAVREAIVAGRFEDAPRMVHFDQVFAERFIDAWDHVQSGRRPTRAWAVAFDEADTRRLVIVQQLLLGMNAHINLDLGIAAQAAAPGAALPALQRDFDEIGLLLAELTGGFVEQVGDLSPWFGLLDRVGGRTDGVIIKWSIDAARDFAWQLANELADSETNPSLAIAARDEEAAGLADLIVRPGFVVSAALLIARTREPNDVNRVTRFLRRDPASPV